MFNFLLSICEYCNNSTCICECSIGNNVSSNSNNDNTSFHFSVEQSCEHHNQTNSIEVTADSTTLKENNLIYNNTTIKNNTCLNGVHASGMYENVHENRSSMSAKSLLNLGLSRRGFKMGHLNIKGIPNKIDKIYLLLNSSQNNRHIIGLRETYLKSYHNLNSIFEIRNYQLFRKNRITSDDRPEQGGRLIVYEKLKNNCKSKYDLECERIECVRVEILPTNCKRFYRKYI